MIKSMWKIALVAEICVATVFVLTAVVYMMGWVNVEVVDGILLSAVAIVLFILYVALSAYLLYAAFASKPKLKRVLLFCDCASATTANGKVIEKIVKTCAKHSDGLKVNKARVTEDDHSGLALTVHVSIKSGEAQNAIDKMRCMLQDSFADSLGLQFNSINFVIDKLSSFTPDSAQADKKAGELAEQRRQAQEQYFNSACNCDKCDNAAINTVEAAHNDTLNDVSVVESDKLQTEHETEPQDDETNIDIEKSNQSYEGVIENDGDLSEHE